MAQNWRGNRYAIFDDVFRWYGYLRLLVGLHDFHFLSETIVNDAILLLNHQNLYFWGSLTIICDYSWWSPTIGPAMRCLRCIVQVYLNYFALVIFSKARSLVIFFRAVNFAGELASLKGFRLQFPLSWNRFIILTLCPSSPSSSVSTSSIQHLCFIIFEPRYNIHILVINST